MKIVVVGDGKVGATLVSQLVKESHDVTVIDNNAAVLRRSTDTMDVLGIHGNEMCIRDRLKSCPVRRLQP